jgi:hypothetical protein
MAAILFLALAASTSAQTLTVNGVNLSLGESETKARADITTARMEMHQMGEDTYTVSAKRGDLFDLFGGIAFTKGRVTWVQRNWYLNETRDDKNALAIIFYSAMASLLEDNDQANCTISVKTQDRSPSEGIMKTTKIECVRPNRIHNLILIATDCSAGCSIGDFSPSLSEAIKSNPE